MADSIKTSTRTCESESNTFLFFYLVNVIDYHLFSVSRPSTNLAEHQLESLLLEGGLLEIYVDQIKLLTKLVHSSRRTHVTSDVEII
jgi:hypothetical protein